ncbi:DMT family transporter [Paenibacillus sp. FSL W8-0919]|uniref:DMT family transporter n=1 Tax=Paenibacillus sp. FSL W8-0919 TaxID=2954707 RepID=UPI0030F5ADC3
MERWKGMLYLFGAFTLAGTSVITAWLLNGKLGAFTITAISLLLVLMILVPMRLQALVRTLRSRAGTNWRQLLLQAVFGMFLFRMFMLFGLSHTSAAEAGIITGATPAITVVLARLVLKERVNRFSLLGIASTVSGIILIQGLFSQDYPFTVQHLIGNVLVLCAASSESVFNILSRMSSTKNDGRSQQPVDPVVQTTLVSAIAFLLCLIPAGFEHPLRSLAGIAWEEWLALIWYGPFVTALAFVFWYAGIRRCDASTAAAFSGMMPFTALVLSVVLLGQRAGVEQWAGGLLVAGGMVLIGVNQKRIGGERNIGKSGLNLNTAKRT